MDTELQHVANLQVAFKMWHLIFDLEMDMKRVMRESEIASKEALNSDMVAINTILIQKKQLDIQMEKLNLCRFCRDNKIKRSELEIVSLDMLPE